MKTGFELWDIESANLVGSYDTEDAALSDVHDTVLTCGPAAIDTLALGRIDARGRAKPIAAADDLRRLAEEWAQRPSASLRVTTARKPRVATAN